MQRTGKLECQPSSIAHWSKYSFWNVGMKILVLALEDGGRVTELGELQNCAMIQLPHLKSWVTIAEMLV